MAKNSAQEQSWWTRIGWLMLFWAAGVGALALVAYVIRLFMNSAGFSS